MKLGAPLTAVAPLSDTASAAMSCDE